MFIFKVTVVLYFIKILNSSRNFYRLRMTSLTSTNVFTISCLSIEPPPPPCKVSIALFVDYSYYSRTIRTIRRLFADYSYYSSTIRGLFVLFVDYSRTIRTIRRLFALFVDYSHYSLHYSSFINCHSCWRRKVRNLFQLFHLVKNSTKEESVQSPDRFVSNGNYRLLFRSLSEALQIAKCFE